MKKIKWILNHIENIICTSAMAVTLVLLVIQVVMRYVFNHSPVWSEELARMLFIWMVFIGGSYAAQHREHIKIDAGIKIFPKPMRKYVLILGMIVLIAFSAIIVYYGGLYTLKMFENHKISLTMKFNMGYVYGAIPIGFAMMIIRIIQVDLLPAIGEIVKKDKEREGENQCQQD